MVCGSWKKFRAASGLVRLYRWNFNRLRIGYLLGFLNGFCMTEKT
ncbi:hypothetical protein NEILACOT_03940 [Neisseria lactamica ATCC 23970]|uniref:Uncharacterized protein n=1 Tax=Neisseria lactamica ATCC 23970 TaxID=546265 RepID=D0W8T6_NEILA|nr:hypothetical protein NEILACOT_03940 [Neisseria lactamica ATCC 23970]